MPAPIPGRRPRLPAHAATAAPVTPPAPAPVPSRVPAHRADWSQPGADDAPVEVSQLAYGASGRDALVAALTAGYRAGTVIAGTVVDLRTGERVTRVGA